MNMNKFLIVTPPYNQQSNGVVILHELCESLKKLGFQCDKVLYGFNDQRDLVINRTLAEIQEYVNDGYVIYPEVIAGNPLGAKRVVRYLLNFEGAVNGNALLAGPNDFILAFSKRFHPAPHGVLFRVLPKPGFDTINCSLPRHRPLDVTYIGKGAQYDQCSIVPGTLEITRQFPTAKQQLSLILKKTRFFFSWDIVSDTSIDALLCGAIPVFLTDRPIAASDLDQWELGRIPRAQWQASSSQMGQVFVPEDFLEVRERFLNMRNQLLESYEQRQMDVIALIKQHFGA